VVFLNGRFPSLGTVLDAMRHADPVWLVLAAVAQAMSIDMFARQQTSLLRAVGVPLTNGRSLAITYASTAISVTMPVGGAVAVGFTIGQWRNRGATAAVGATVTVLSGIASIVGLTGLYLAGSGAVLAIHPDTLHTLVSPVTVAIAGSLVAAILLVVLLRRVVRARPPQPYKRTTRTGSGRFSRLVSSTAQAGRAAAAIPRRYALAALALAAGNWLTDLLCLALTARALHLRLGLAPLAGVYLAVQLVRLIPLTPGGIGLIETSLLTGLVAAGAAHTDAAAVVLIYRLLSCWLIVPIGATALMMLRRTHPVPGHRPGRGERTGGRCAERIHRRPVPHPGRRQSPPRQAGHHRPSRQRRAPAPSSSRCLR
jgi:uncharacterized protein (TIRG00374 family)